MPIRKPLGALPSDEQPMPHMAAGAGAPGAMNARPGMTGAPGNNPTAGQPGPESGMAGIPQPPPPIQPTGGGPTSPLNISTMLQPQEALPPAPRVPLPPYGDAHGTPTPDGLPGAGGPMGAPMGAPPMPGANAGGMMPPEAPGAEAARSVHAGSPSLVMLRMLHAMGQV